MAAYDSSVIVSGSALNVSQLITELNELAVSRTDSGITSGVTSTTSASPTSLMTVSHTCASDEVAIMFGIVQCSVSNATTVGAFRPRINTVEIQPDFVFTDVVTGTSGANTCRLITASAFNLSGVIDFDIYWYRTTGAGTLYAGGRSIQVFSLKRR